MPIYLLLDESGTDGRFDAIFSLPGFNWVLWRGYRWFNRHRYRVSRHCRLPNQNNSGRLQS